MEAVIWGTFTLLILCQTHGLFWIPKVRVHMHEGHTANFFDNFMLLFGGDIGGKCTNDLWIFDCEDEKWEKVEVEGPTPPPRYGHAAVSFGSKLLVWGGADRYMKSAHSSVMFYNDLWMLDTTTMQWTRLEVARSPAKRYGHSLSVVNGRIILFGGYGNQARFNDVWELDFDNMKWISLDATGQKPAARTEHTGIGVPEASLVVFGGSTSTGPSNELWEFNLDGRRWYRWELNLPGAKPRGALQPGLVSPSARHAHAAVTVEGNRMVIFGGTASKQSLNDIWVLNCGGGVDFRVALGRVRARNQLQTAVDRLVTEVGDMSQVSLEKLASVISEQQSTQLSDLKEKVQAEAVESDKLSQSLKSAVENLRVRVMVEKEVRSTFEAKQNDRWVRQEEEAAQQGASLLELSRDVEKQREQLLAKDQALAAELKQELAEAVDYLSGQAQAKASEWDSRFREAADASAEQISELDSMIDKTAAAVGQKVDAAVQQLEAKAGDLRGELHKSVVRIDSDIERSGEEQKNAAKHSADARELLRQYVDERLTAVSEDIHAEAQRAEREEVDVMKRFLESKRDTERRLDAFKIRTEGMERDLKQEFTETKVSFAGDVEELAHRLEQQISSVAVDIEEKAGNEKEILEGKLKAAEKSIAAVESRLGTTLETQRSRTSEFEAKTTLGIEQVHADLEAEREITLKTNQSVNERFGLLVIEVEKLTHGLDEGKEETHKRLEALRADLVKMGGAVGDRVEAEAKEREEESQQILASLKQRIEAESDRAVSVEDAARKSLEESLGIVRDDIKHQSEKADEAVGGVALELRDRTKKLASDLEQCDERVTQVMNVLDTHKNVVGALNDNIEQRVENVNKLVERQNDERVREETVFRTANESRLAEIDSRLTNLRADTDDLLTNKMTALAQHIEAMSGVIDTTKITSDGNLSKIERLFEKADQQHAATQRLTGVVDSHEELHHGTAQTLQTVKEDLADLHAAVDIKVQGLAQQGENHSATNETRLAEVTKKLTDYVDKAIDVVMKRLDQVSADLSKKAETSAAETMSKAEDSVAQLGTRVSTSLDALGRTVEKLAADQKGDASRQEVADIKRELEERIVHVWNDASSNMKEIIDESIDAGRRDRDELANKLASETQERQVTVSALEQDARAVDSKIKWMESEVLTVSRDLRSEITNEAKVRGHEHALFKASVENDMTALESHFREDLSRLQHTVQHVRQQQSLATSASREDLLASLRKSPSSGSLPPSTPGRAAALTSPVFGTLRHAFPAGEETAPPTAEEK